MPATVTQAIIKEKKYSSLSAFGEVVYDSIIHEFQPEGRVRVFNNYGDEIQLDLSFLSDKAAIELLEQTDDKIAYRLYKEVTNKLYEVWIIFDFAARTDRVKMTIQGNLPKRSKISLPLTAKKLLKHSETRLWDGEIGEDGEILHSVSFDWSDAPTGIFETDKVSWNVNKDFEIDPVTITTTTTQYALRYHYQRKTFYANGRHWVFWSDGTDGKYSTSTDGSSWETPATFCSGISDGIRFAIWFDGTYGYYVRANNTQNDGLHFRRFTPESDGSITWSAVEQDIPESTGYFFFPSICADSNGKVWIAYRYSSDASNFYPYVTMSGNSDGTWGTTPGGFPYQLSITADGGWRISVVPLTSGKIFVLYGESGGDTLKVKSWDGSSWNAEQTTPSNINKSYRCQGVAVGDDVWLTYLKDTTYDVLVAKYTYSTNSIGSETTLLSSSDTREHAPAIAKDATDIYVFYGRLDTDHIYYRKWNGSSWESEVDWINESTDELTGLENVNCFYESGGNAIGIIYLTKTASPYNVRYASLSVAAGATMAAQYYRRLLAGGF